MNACHNVFMQQYNKACHRFIKNSLGFSGLIKHKFSGHIKLCSMFLGFLGLNIKGMFNVCRISRLI